MMFFDLLVAKHVTSRAAYVTGTYLTLAYYSNIVSICDRNMWSRAHAFKIPTSKFHASRPRKDLTPSYPAAEIYSTTFLAFLRREFWAVSTYCVLEECSFVTADIDLTIIGLRWMELALDRVKSEA